MLHSLVKHLPPWSDSVDLQYPKMCELKSPTIVINFPVFLASSTNYEIPS